MQNITPCLWFDHQAEDAANFYVSLFSPGPGGAKIKAVTRYGMEGAKVSGQAEGAVMTVAFEILGQNFLALNGGPVFQFSPAISFIVNCRTQEEVDRLWGKLSEGGQEEQCGWLKDRYGVSWQIVPTALGEMLSTQDARKSELVMKALLQMKKIKIEGLRKAYEDT
jgi:predicted 3-demethylubiquinone-9 3-methyltransferase (glyoxalase superfamily)